jgi:hypothetical protein
MLLLIDACFWSHCRELHDAKIWDLRDILQSFSWGYTKQVFQEINDHQLDDYVPDNAGMIIEVRKVEMEQLYAMDPIAATFDEADQSLIVIGKREDGLVLTDDWVLAEECKGLNVSALRLPEFMLNLVAIGIIEKTILYRALRFWDSKGRFQTKEIRRLKKFLQALK